MVLKPYGGNILYYVLENKTNTLIYFIRHLLKDFFFIVCHLYVHITVTLRILNFIRIFFHSDF